MSQNHFARLPLELRESIYKHAFEDVHLSVGEFLGSLNCKCLRKHHQRHLPGVLHTCQMMRNEATSIFCDNVKISILGYWDDDLCYAGGIMKQYIKATTQLTAFNCITTLLSAAMFPQLQTLIFDFCLPKLIPVRVHEYSTDAQAANLIADLVESFAICNTTKFAAAQHLAAAAKNDVGFPATTLVCPPVEFSCELCDDSCVFSWPGVLYDAKKKAIVNQGSKPLLEHEDGECPGPISLEQLRKDVVSHVEMVASLPQEQEDRMNTLPWDLPSESDSDDDGW